MTISPPFDQVLVEVEHQKEETTKGGLILHVPKYEHIPETGTVYAIGDTVKAEYKVGDRVFFKTEKPRGFHDDEDRPLFCLYPEQILGVYE